MDQLSKMDAYILLWIYRAADKWMDFNPTFTIDPLYEVVYVHFTPLVIYLLSVIVVSEIHEISFSIRAPPSTTAHSS